MSQQVTLRSGYVEELAVVLANNNALRRLYERYYPIYALLVQFYTTSGVSIDGDARDIIVGLHLVEVVGAGIQRKRIVGEILRSSASGNAYALDALPYNTN